MFLLFLSEANSSIRDFQENDTQLLLGTRFSWSQCAMTKIHIQIQNVAFVDCIFLTEVAKQVLWEVWWKETLIILGSDDITCIFDESPTWIWYMSFIQAVIFG